MSAIQTSRVVPLFNIVKSFIGDPDQFLKRAKYIESYAQLVGMDDTDIPKIVHARCKGSVADFVKRYLKEIIKKRFDYISDQHQTLAMLRLSQQNPDEGVQIYGKLFI